MKEIELLEKRKPREKHFLREDGTVKVCLYNEDIHYLKNDKYVEIDNTLIEQDDFYVNKSNSYSVKFNKKETNNLLEIEQDNYYLKLKLLNSKIDKIDINKYLFKYLNILNGIDIEYKLINGKIKENIVINDKSSIDQKIVFNVDTNLKLNLKEDKSIIASKDDNEIFRFEAPFMIDNKTNECCDIFYNIDEKDGQYLLELNVNKDWLNKAEYPVIIDPTIILDNQSTSVKDTYIYPGDTNISRGSLSYFKIGVEKVNGVDVPNRALIKFNLPPLSTGDQVVSAQLNLTGYETNFPASDFKHVVFALHPITTDWNESTANWNNMNSNYESRIEGVSDCDLMPLLGSDNSQFNLLTSDITNIVKHWYTDKVNNGLMIKQNTEEYKNSVVPTFSSRESNSTPYLVIIYRNQNGLENYMNYFKQSFNIGNTYVNNYNGNLVGLFDIGKTIGGKLPANLNLVYNTNDVISNNNIGYGLGWRLNLSQTIEEETINEILYLKYIDDDSTIHYFYLDDGIYKDEDGLNLIITDNTNYYLLEDKDGNKMKFIKSNGVGYLSEIRDVKDNTITISYDNNNRITTIVDADNAQISIVYNNNNIVVTNPDGNRTINLSNNKITSIVSYLGTMSFSYNANNIITEIVDIDQTKIAYEYYEISPFRIKKVSEYGYNNTLGRYYNVLYQFNSTTITDNDGKTTTMTFKDNGTLESTSSLKAREDVGDAYGKSINYGEAVGTTFTKYSNKLMEDYIPIQSVKNYVTNSNFESTTIDFSAPSGVSLSLSQDEAYIGKKSLKIISNNIGSIISRNISVSKGNDYTFSAYLKTGNIAKVALSYIDSSNEVVRVYGNEVDDNTDFYRSDVTINYPTTATGNLILEIITDSGTTYVDAIQLEKGEVANDYNLVENSDFSSGYADWNVSADYHDVIYNFADPTDYPTINLSNLFETVTLSTGKTALKINMNPDIITKFSKTFNISGAAGDVYTLSLWYKNKGIVSDYGMGAFFYNVIDMDFDYVEGSNPYGPILQSKSFIPNETEWQYFSVNFVAAADYNSFTLFLDQELNANEFYITDINLFKNIGSISYDYDDNGNIILSRGLNNDLNEFKYDKNNQLIEVTNPLGKNYCFEYDNIITNRMIRGISNSGISNIVNCDVYGNPICTKIAKENLEEITNALYRIRQKGTDNYFRLINNQLNVDVDKCGHDKWYFESSGSYYTINHSIINNKYFTVSNSNLILSSYDGDNSLFSLIKNNNGSYKIQSKSNGKYLKIINNSIVLDNLEDNNDNYNFYIENFNKLFIENDAKYDTSGKYLTQIIDSLFNKTSYNIDDVTGLLNYITNANGCKIEYEYNNKKQLVKIKNNNKFLEFSYNQNLLTKVFDGNIEYNFLYDNFSNLTSVKIGNNITLINNDYEINNGNLYSSSYGNNNSILYNYDDFNRIKEVVKSDNTYRYYYDNNGELVKIVDNSGYKKFIYDLAKRLSKYITDNFKIIYNYDLNDNITSKEYIIGNNREKVENTYNSEDSIIQTEFDTKIIDYIYDEIGRLTNKRINNTFNIEYKYLSNGYRNSTKIKSIILNNEKYDYEYDSLGNIVKIYYNNELQNEYIYDIYNQLVTDHNYLLNTTFRYKYDNYGNVISKKTYYINTYNQISQQIYKYQNSNWKNQLTKFNNQLITYDNIGNPTSIGNKVLTWINGRQLSSYSDNTVSVTYKYDFNGVREKKIVNDIETTYKLEGSKIVSETTNNNTIFYIRNGVGDLIGFKYNGSIYYYLKNLFGDIIAILNDTNNIIARYNYDAYGNIISITDGSGAIINDSTSVAHINSFRYRSYYYDNETSLYYLNNRYYSPELCRFINLDGLVSENNDIISCNLYTYCNNNPINDIDNYGKSVIGGILLLLGVGALAGLAGQAISDGVNSVMSGELKVSPWQDYVGSGVGGSVGTGISLVTANPLLVGGGSAAVSRLTSEGLKNIGREEKRPFKDIMKDTAVDAAIGTISAVPAIKAPKITTGRNSYSAVFKSNTTKIRKDIIKEVSGKTIFKGVASNIINNSFSSSINGMRNYIDDKLGPYYNPGTYESIKWDINN
ncbi:MAG: DNRLRE domain-containing protein [Bacilli bacterium]|nr:DNRLRE domain-containing protein [Bacilli bacterium]